MSRSAAPRTAASAAQGGTSDSHYTLSGVAHCTLPGVAFGAVQLSPGVGLRTAQPPHRLVAPAEVTLQTKVAESSVPEHSYVPVPGHGPPPPAPVQVLPGVRSAAIG